MHAYDFLMELIQNVILSEFLCVLILVFRRCDVYMFGFSTHFL